MNSRGKDQIDDAGKNHSHHDVGLATKNTQKHNINIIPYYDFYFMMSISYLCLVRSDRKVTAKFVLRKLTLKLTPSFQYPQSSVKSLHRKLFTYPDPGIISPGFPPCFVAIQDRIPCSFIPAAKSDGPLIISHVTVSKVHSCITM